jgi:probable addiction module antidote protein
MTIKIAKWDTAEYLKTKEEVAGYLDAALEDGDPQLVKLALSNIARAKERSCEAARSPPVVALVRNLKPIG